MLRQITNLRMLRPLRCESVSNEPPLILMPAQADVNNHARPYAIALRSPGHEGGHGQDQGRRLGDDIHVHLRSPERTTRSKRPVGNCVGFIDRSAQRQLLARVPDSLGCRLLPTNPNSGVLGRRAELSITMFGPPVRGASQEGRFSAYPCPLPMSIQLRVQPDHAPSLYWAMTSSYSTTFTNGYRP